MITKFNIMRILYYFSFCLLFHSFLLAQEIPKGYEKYEAEDLSYFRKKVTFQDPFPNNVIEIDTTQLKGKVSASKDTSVMVKLDYGHEIEELLERHKNMDQNQQEKMVKGFRIQLYAGLDRTAADKTKVEFLGIWPDIQVFQTYNRPTFKVRVGNFLTRTEAEMFCQRVKNQFTGAFVVPELIQIIRKENSFEAPPGNAEER
jgi:hypothetical protein